MTTRTPAQVAQLIQFYNDCLPRVEAFGLYNLPGTHYKFFIEGKKLAKAQQESERAATIAKSRATRWTAEEYDAMAAAYFKHGRNQRACLAEFRAFSERHTDKSVMLAVYSCAALDETVTEITGLKDYANGLLNALNAIEPGRFKATR